MLEAAAGRFRILTERTDSECLRALVSIPLPSGGLIEFRVLVERIGGNLAMREGPESPTRQLPAYCPERHINADGSFCLFWRARENPLLETPDDAAGWWERTVHFLDLQRRASATRRWPREAAWAHGDEAAEYQAEVEAALRELGLLRVGVSFHRLRLRHRGRWLRLEANGRRLFSLQHDEMRLANLGQPCPCGRLVPGRRKRVPLKSCGEHADVAARLVRAFSAMQAAEQKFADDSRRRGRRCCGTMDLCCLRHTVKVAWHDG